MKHLCSEEVKNSELAVAKGTSEGSLSEQIKEPFVPINIDGMQEAINVLKTRLPKSAHVYNMTLMASTFPSIQCYSLNGEISKNSIFLLVDIRQDFNQDITISVPLDFKVLEDVKEAFVNTSRIDWREKYMFSALDRLISPMILEISTIYKENPTLISPEWYFYMSQEDAASLHLEIPPDVEVKSLSKIEGEDLLLNGWKYTGAGTAEYLREIVENGLTAGLYVDGTPVCGLIEYRSGLMGMLYTAKDHRNKGYAKICTRNLMNQLGIGGFAVTCGVECHNVTSIQFHLKMGMVKSHVCDYITYEKIGFEKK